MSSPPLPKGASALPPLPPGATFAPAAIDQRGAPANIRLAVGSASNPDDRLATLRKFYPDAQPYQQDNFVFTDPKSGQPTIYNPKGLDWGDVPSITPELGEMLGGTIGGIAAAPAAATGLGIAAVPLGVGLGAAAGRNTMTGLAELLMGTQDTRGVGQRLLDTGVTAAANTAGQRIGQVLAQGAGAVVPRMVGAAQGGAQALADALRIGVSPTAGMVTGNRGVQIMENALANTPGGASVMQRSAEQAVGQTGDAAERIAAAIGAGRTQQQAGAALQAGARDFVEQFKTQAGELYTKAESLIPPQTRINLQNTLTTLADQDPGFSATPALGEKLANSKLRGYLSALMQDMGFVGKDGAPAVTEDTISQAMSSGRLPLAAIRAMRTKIGKQLADPTAISDISQAELKQVYGALSEDIRQAAAATSPEASAALSRADAYYNAGLGRIEAVIDPLLKQGTPEKAYQVAISGMRDGGTNLWRLRRSLPGEQWDVVSSYTLRRMGNATPGQQGGATLDELADNFSPSTFLTNWSKTSAEAKRALFSGKRYGELRPELDSLVRTVDRLKDASKMANPSGTARNLLFAGALLGAGGQAAQGDPEGALGTAAAAVLAPRMAAKLMTNPGFVRWLGQSAQVVAAAPDALPAQLVRLTTIAKANPEIRDAIEAYRQAIRPSPKPRG